MKNQEIKLIHCAKYLDFNAMKPGEVDSFTFPLQINIGEVDSEESDVYQIMVVSPDMIRSIRDHYIILTPLFDPKSISSILSGIVEYCNTTDDPYLNLQNYFRWEYKDYKY